MKEWAWGCALYFVLVFLGIPILVSGVISDNGWMAVSGAILVAWSLGAIPDRD